jgi:predicted membrane channel-forming protein YqfA (hemolysin III family)
VTLATAWFVYESWWPVALNLAAAVATAALATKSTWALKPGQRRPPGQMVALISCIVLCYMWPLAFQASRDLSARLPPQDPAAPRPPLSAAGCAAGAALALGAGAAVYAAGLPERAFPGVFDVIGSSHQLMHVTLLAAHAFEYAFVLEMWARRRAERLGA